ncbi:KAP family NTPase [Clostridium sp. FP2]|uniref:P-loop NTPase fold protein n=1 Tax=Clostridium sp. FP2 TaxID=2724481 RepID=UPI001CCB74D8|nr:P-loop NTPase fold protein [Clostridium sp. FP2]MBZ9625610.1 KAP family NTPase [Clostridium sp. FP2]
MNRWFSNVIQNNIKYLVDQINYFCYKFELIIIFIGIIAAITMIFKYKKEWSYIYELSKCLKISLFMILLSYLIKALNITTIKPIFNVTFYNLMPITIIVILIGYLLDRYFFYKVSSEYSKCKIKIRFIKYTIAITYVFLLISSLYSIKDIMLPFIWQINLVSIMYSECLKNTEKTIACSLYETRSAQLNVLKDIIKQTDYENYGISINGNWGSGKSELISALINDCKKHKKYCIYIKPMISDSQERLIKEFQKSISNLMREHGIYSGRNSSTDKYFREILKLVEFNKRVTLYDFMDLIKEERSYKELKKDLQEDINALLCNDNKKNNKEKDRYDRLIVIIDDFDRVEENKQLDILSFIKEVIDFDGCVTIIALDYENLKLNKIVKQRYLEKFIATQIPLADVDFEEIINFHAKEILNINSFKNSFSQKILEEINNNIYNYFGEIELRLNSYIYSKQNNKNIKEFKSYCVERRMNINNSRRVKHFLNDIKNTVLLIDGLYENRNDGEKLLTTVDVSELVYFFNYLKIFNNEDYKEIVRLNGVVEYIDYLDMKDINVKGEYFKAILGNLIPESVEKKDFEYQEIKDLRRINTLNFIKDIFIDYYFTMYEINLLIDSQRYLEIIDNRKLNKDKDNHVEILVLYQKSIFRGKESHEKTLNRIEYLANYIIDLLKNSKLSIVEVLSITEKADINYVNHYLEKINKLIDENSLEMEPWFNIEEIKSYLDKIEKENRVINQGSLANLIKLVTLEKYEEYNYTKVKEIFTESSSTEELISNIIKYSLDIEIIDSFHGEPSINEIIKVLINKVNFSKFTFIRKNELVIKLNEFIAIYENTYKLLNFINNVNNVVIFKKYEEDLGDLTDYSIDEIKKIIKELSKEQQITTGMSYNFKNLINHIINKKQIKRIDYKSKKNIKDLYTKILEEDSNMFYEFDFLLNVERILYYKEK